MSQYRWDQTLDVGVEAMNDEHRILIDKMNIVYDLFAEGAAFNAQQTALDDLLAYAKQHFDEEEEYVASIQFEELGQHKIIHKMLLEKLGGERDKAVEAGAIPESFFKMLSFWIVTHIKGVDTKYGAHAASLAH